MRPARSRKPRMLSRCVLLLVSPRCRTHRTISFVRADLCLPILAGVAVTETGTSIEIDDDDEDEDDASECNTD